MTGAGDAWQRHGRLGTWAAALASISLSASIACSRSAADDAPADAAARSAALAAAAAQDTSAIQLPGSVAPALSGAGPSPSTSAGTTPPVAPASSSPNAASSGIAGQDLLRALVDEHHGLIELARATARRTDASSGVRAEARALERSQRTEIDELESLLSRAYREQRTPTVTPRDAAANGRTTSEVGPALDRAFREAVLRHHRDELTTIDAYSAKLGEPRVASLARRLREARTRAIAELQKSLGAS